MLIPDDGQLQNSTQLSTDTTQTRVPNTYVTEWQAVLYWENGAINLHIELKDN